MMAICMKRNCNNLVLRGFRFCRRNDCGKAGEEE